MKKDIGDQPPLCVDLDGTLIRTDCLQEAFLSAFKRNPLLLFAALALLFKGKAALKTALSRWASINVERLPIRGKVLSYLKREKQQGRTLILVTATHQTIAEELARYHGIFGEVYGSDGRVNLKGNNKAEFLCRKFGEGGFDYIGDDASDLPVWKAARRSLVVAPSEALLRRIRAVAEHPICIEEKKVNRWLLLTKALRPHHWTKNLLIAVAPFVDHAWDNPHNFFVLMLIFISLSLGASASYVVNDLLDLAHDRASDARAGRPFAAGLTPLSWGLASIPVLLACSFLIAGVVGGDFPLLLTSYLAISILYSWILKKEPIWDVLTLAGLYSLRVLIGGVCLNITLSPWLIAFAMFVFLSLAFAKRYSELYNLRKQNKSDVAGRGYQRLDLEQIAIFGTASGYLSVLVIALYINSPGCYEEYRQPGVLWFICPVLIYWISRIWLVSHRGMMHEDPLVFALSDRVSYAMGALLILIPILAGPM